MIGIESRDGLNEVAMKVCMESANVSTPTNNNPCHEMLSHYGNETLRESLPYCRSG